MTVELCEGSALHWGLWGLEAIGIETGSPGNSGIKQTLCNGAGRAEGPEGSLEDGQKVEGDGDHLQGLQGRGWGYCRQGGGQVRQAAKSHRVGSKKGGTGQRPNQTGHTDLLNCSRCIQWNLSWHSRGLCVQYPPPLHSPNCVFWDPRNWPPQTVPDARPCRNGMRWPMRWPMAA